MRTVKVMVSSVTAYSQSRQHDTPRKDKESWDAYEERTWREKCNVNADGNVVIPAMAFKQGMDTAAKKLGKQVPGKGKSTYTKYFVADVICDSDVVLPIKKSEVVPVTINANADGVRGSGKRVKRTFPVVPSFENVAVNFTIMDDTITPQVFEEVFAVFASSVGVGRFRPEKGGLNGRLRATKFIWG